MYGQFVSVPGWKIGLQDREDENFVVMGFIMDEDDEIYKAYCSPQFDHESEDQLRFVSGYRIRHDDFEGYEFVEKVSEIAEALGMHEVEIEGTILVAEDEEIV